MLDRIKDDLRGFLERDPASRSRAEIVLCYPGFHALLLHRAANFLWRRDLLLLGRLVSAMSRFLTGIEIHPAARVGRALVIDHGMGVVIGETATIGDRVTIYQDVTLGGTSLKREIRHPQVGNDVIIGAGAQVLGPVRVGNGARVGSNAVVVRDVPDGATVVGIPARQVGGASADIDAVMRDLPPSFSAYGTPRDGVDPLQGELLRLKEEIAVLHDAVKELRQGRQADLAEDAKATAGQWDVSI